MAVQNATDASFPTEVLATKGTTLVDFWAPWCKPCQNFNPVLDKLTAETLEPKGVKVVKVDIQANPQTPNQYAVRTIPTLVLFKDGKPVASYSRSFQLSQVGQWLAQTL